ncbi:short chain dehydrogenase domain-containing protein [Ditylenchus destructor]|uniref:Short chain dehydrogenase domain-containing protein n=1 Tax=Ditylenchus destructor TaxID=166010 RepID=A0AAD4QW24_9BILA|nr:short chain dehydrogenase domain-containing protein [Ditylenchus destructor]
MLSAENASKTNGSQPKSKCKLACNSKKKFGSRTTAAEVLKDIDLRGKTILITGTTSGIGVETAKALALAGAHAKGFTPKIDIIQVDLSSLKSVRNAANDFISKEWPLHALILNAGLLSFNGESSSDGHERTFAVNHLAQFYFTQLLMQKLQESAPSRLVIVSSSLHTKTGIRASESLDSKLQKLESIPNSAMSSFFLYCNSKLCNMLVAKKAHKLVHDKGVNVYVLHPGIIRTELFRDRKNWFGVISFFMWPFQKNVEQGAATTVYCAAHPDANESGKYYVDCAVAENQTDKALVNDESLQDALWERSNELIKNFEANNK